MLRKTLAMLESTTIITVIISFMGGITAALVKGARGVRQIAAIIIVALVAGVWISPLVIIAAEQIMGSQLKETVGNSIVAVVSISSWNLLEALAENKLAGRFFKKLWSENG